MSPQITFPSRVSSCLHSPVAGLMKCFLSNCQVL